MTGTNHLFAGRKTLVLSMAQVKQLLPMTRCIELQHAAFCDHARGTAWSAPASWLRVNKHGGWIKIVAGYVDSNQGMGVKMLARYPKNPPGQNLGSLLVLFDPANGFPLAIFDSVYITGARTGAGGGLATQRMARPDSKVVGILGAGVQARFTMLAIAELFPGLEAARVYSRDRARREAFARRLTEATGLQHTAVEAPRAAVEAADIIVTATNSPEPVLFRDWVRPGAHVNAMGIRSEIHPGVFPGARVIGDAKDVAIDDGKFGLAVKAGVVQTGDLAGELGEVLLGQIPGRVTDDEITVFDSSGLGVQDIICARYIYEQAQQQHLGAFVDFGLAEEP